MVAVSADNVGMIFRHGAQARPVLENLSLRIESGEIVAVRGANGTGKTTLLNLIAGLLTPSQGRIRIDGTSADRTLIGFVQQDYTSSLLPWFSVAENVAIPLRLRGMAGVERRRRAEQCLEDLGFTTLALDAYPHQLSGGQRQRVAIARALISKPAILLLDEPFANLDGPSVRALQETLLHVQDQQRITMIFVSHDLDSAIYLSDRVFLLRGTPARLQAEFAVDLPRPRRREQLLSAEFAAARAKIVGAEEAIP